MKRSAAGEPILTIKGVMRPMRFPKECIPAHLPKELLFGEAADGIHVIREICTDFDDSDLAPQVLQLRLCDGLGVNPDKYFSLFAEMAKGTLPDDVIILPSDEGCGCVLWFAISNSKLVCIDITDWHIYPMVHVRDFPCCSYESFAKVQKKTLILQELSSIVDSLPLSSSQLLAMSKLMKDLYEDTTVDAR